MPTQIKSSVQCLKFYNLLYLVAVLENLLLKDGHFYSIITIVNTDNFFCSKHAYADQPNIIKLCQSVDIQIKLELLQTLKDLPDEYWGGIPHKWDWGTVYESCHWYGYQTSQSTAKTLKDTVYTEQPVHWITVSHQKLSG